MKRQNLSDFARLCDLNHCSLALADGLLDQNRGVPERLSVQGALLRAFKAFSLPREIILSAEFLFSFITEGTSTPRRRSRFQVLPAPIPQEAS